MDYAAVVRAAMTRARVRLGEVEGAKLSQGQFAERMAGELGSNTTRTAVYGWESGKATPPATALLAAAKLAGLTVDRLVLESQPHLVIDELMEIRAEFEALKRANNQRK